MSFLSRKPPTPRVMRMRMVLSTTFVGTQMSFGWICRYCSIYGQSPITLSHHENFRKFSPWVCTAAI